MTGGDPSDPAPAHAPSSSEEIFARQAREAGITLPERNHASPLVTLLGVALVFGASLGIGLGSGWVNPGSSVSGPAGVLRCTSGPYTVYGSAPALDDPPLANLSQLATNYSVHSHGCALVRFNATPSDSPLLGLENRSSAFALTADAPSATVRASLGDPTLAFPVGLRPVAIIYHLSGTQAPLRLDAAVLAQIFNGSITRWNATAIGGLNPILGASTAPSLRTFYRSDATASTADLGGYLAVANAGPRPGPWLNGTSEPSAAALIAAVAATDGAIGYVPAGLSLPAGVQAAELLNPAGKFVPPTPFTVAAAGAAWANDSVPSETNWTGVSGWNAPGNDSYPITGVWTVVAFKDLGVSYGAKATAATGRLVDLYLWWLVQNGMPSGSALGPMTFPGSLTTLAIQALGVLAYHGVPLSPFGRPPPDVGGAAGEGQNDTGRF